MPRLYVVATPIGNLSDASARMVDTLRGVSLIAAEDTRVSGNLLRHFDIRCRMVSLHRHNEAEKAPWIVRKMLEESIDVALVTDAGTPAISDPGHLLVREAAAAGIEVLAVPGPTAFAAALSISGFDIRSFAFYGFLPRETGDLKKALHALLDGPPIAVLYESPHRILHLVEAIYDVYAQCRVCVCCDLTKLHETTVRGAVDAVIAQLRTNPKVEKGEYCVVVDLHGVPARAAERPAVRTEALLLDALLQGMDMQEAISRVCQDGIRKNEAKRAALAVRRFLQDSPKP